MWKSSGQPDFITQICGTGTGKPQSNSIIITPNYRSMSHEVPPCSGSNLHSLFPIFGRPGQTLLHCSCCYTKDAVGQAVHFSQGTLKSVCKPKPLQHRRANCYPGSSEGGFLSPDLRPQKGMKKVKHHGRKDWLERKDGDTTWLHTVVGCSQASLWWGWRQ